MTNVQMMINDHLEEMKALLQDKDVTMIADELYSDWEPEQMRYYLAAFQYLINSYIEFMNNKFQINGHYNADESRGLIQIIQIYDEDRRGLVGTQFEYSINLNYAKYFEYCRKFLHMSRGSDIPADYSIFPIEKYAPIAIHPQDDMFTEVARGTKLSLKMVGSGSYADVFRFKDPLYRCWVGVKRLKPNSTSEEIQRFRNEYEVLYSLHSPYILEVYSFNDGRNEYTMEFADFTLFEYLNKHPDLDIKTRKRIAHQVLAGFRYLHSKNLLHRDISFKNVLIFEFDDAIIAKISDLGLVKFEDSTLTRKGTSIKGSLRDPTLDESGFENFGMSNEIYSMTRLLYFIMTNRQGLGRYPSDSVEKFVQKGISNNVVDRYPNDRELLKAFEKVDWR
ncbi:protein kinase domain-containing protein [Lacticaseibacillus porcinae]|uniref:protein kinase domain-containing protein n=1 Tax=Lacticaseibacillus porcinae TaxID=1123687 RepID=UPI000F7A90CE|nr:protein kinase [Lacticaseibacillus porcinae]